MPEQEDEDDLPEEYYKVLEHLGKVFGDNISLKMAAALLSTCHASAAIVPAAVMPLQL